MGGDSGGSSGNTRSTSTSEPWGPAQQPLKDIMSVAGNLFKADVGPQVFPGTTVAPFSLPTQTAINKGVSMASQGNPTQGAFNQSVLQNLMSGGMNSPMFGALGAVSPTAFGGMLDSNPFLDKSLDFQSGKIADKVNDIFGSAGRAFSGAHAQALGDELAGLRYGAASQNYENERARQMQGIGMMADIGGAADQNARAWGALAPTADAFRYADIDRLSKLGSTIEGKQGEIMQEAADKFAQQNALPWERVQMLQNIISPPAVNFGSSTTTGKTSQQQSTNPLGLAMAAPLMLMGK